MESLGYKMGELLTLIAIMRDNQLVNEYSLSSNSFVGENNKKLFRIINREIQKGSNFDLNLIKTEYIKNSNDKDNQYINTVVDMANKGSVSTTNIETIKKFELLRDLKRKGIDIKEFYDDSDVMNNPLGNLVEMDLDYIISEVKKKIESVDSYAAKKAHKVLRYDELEHMATEFDELVENAFSLSEFPLKLVPGSINLTVAATGVGKTTYLQSVTSSALINSDSEVLYITLEQEPAQIFSGIRNMLINSMKYDEVKNRLAMGRVKSGSIQEISNNIKALIEASRPHLIVLDYIKPAIIEGNESGYERMGKIMNMLQDIMIGNEGFMVVAVQGNTNSEGKSLDKIYNSPSAFITEGSRTLESCSTALFISRNDKGNRESVIVKSRYENELQGKKYDVIYTPGQVIKFKEQGSLLIGRSGVKDKKSSKSTYANSNRI